MALAMALLSSQDQQDRQHFGRSWSEPGELGTQSRLSFPATGPGLAAPPGLLLRGLRYGARFLVPGPVSGGATAVFSCRVAPGLDAISLLSSVPKGCNFGRGVSLLHTTVAEAWEVMRV